jgi:hypothetical protein
MVRLEDKRNREMVGGGGGGGVWWGVRERHEGQLNEEYMKKGDLWLCRRASEMSQ